MSDARRRIGAAAERIAVEFLRRHDVRIVDRNVRVGGGEIDLVGRTNGRLLVVEVRSLTSGEPVSAFDRAKEQQLARLSAQIGIGRVDLVAVRLARPFVTVTWLPYVL